MNCSISLITTPGFFEILESIVNEIGANISTEEYSIVENDTTKVITIQLKDK